MAEEHNHPVEEFYVEAPYADSRYLNYSSYDRHHWYGHVEDITDVNLGWWIVGIFLFFIIGALAIVSPAFGLAIFGLLWFKWDTWPKLKKIWKEAGEEVARNQRNR
ncbi:MAG: hypothetical protein M3N29_01700 [Chloroflexota bacterium]|nr:hypothetical protein [Chloroflexota bacterium]